MTVLSPSIWKEKSRAHRELASRSTRPARRRRAAHQPHPVEDFLFTYYPVSFAKLETWHPGIGVRLEVGKMIPAPFDRAPYRQVGERVFADPAHLAPKQLERLRWTRDLLIATRDRPGQFACHGLHEWAMVYRGTEVRHAHSTPLRLAQQEIDTLVESRPIACSHFDAFRFFHKDAQGLNRLQPALMTRPEFEQPGCVHANMDLYNTV